MKRHFKRMLCIPISALLLSNLWSCKDDEPTPPAPTGPSITISDVSTEANSVTFTLTPTNAAYYTYCIASETLTTEPVLTESEQAKTFTYDKLLPSSDYKIIAVAYSRTNVASEETEYPFRTKDSETPNLEIPTGEEPFMEYGDQRIALKSVFYYEESDRYWLFVSPIEGIDNHYDMLYGNGGRNDYISLSFTPSQHGKAINMKSASERYSLYNSMNNAISFASDIGIVTIDFHTGISEGGFIVTRTGADVMGYVEMVSAATGKKLRIYGTCAYNEEEANRSNFVQVNDRNQKIRSAFYFLPDENLSELYLSPASVVMGDLIDQADDYHVRILFDNSIAAQKTPIDITQITDRFEFEYYDPAEGKSVLISNTDLKGATGTVTLYKYALQGAYRVAYDLQIDGMTFKAYADGDLELYSYYHENFYIIGTNDPAELQSAVIDRRDNKYYTIYLSPEAGLTTLEQIEQAEGTIAIKVSPLALQGESRFFYQEKEQDRMFSISHNGKTYDNEDESNRQSMVRGAIEGQKIALEFKETKGQLSGYYAGLFVDAE